MSGQQENDSAQHYFTCYSGYVIANFKELCSLCVELHLQFSCHDVVFRSDCGIDSDASWADGNMVDALALAASQLILQLSL